LFVLQVEQFLPFPVLGEKKKFLAEIKPSQFGTLVVENVQLPKAKTVSRSEFRRSVSVLVEKEKVTSLRGLHHQICGGGKSFYFNVKASV